jgi:hypothetical protein
MKTTIQKTLASLLLVMLLVIGTVTPAHAQEIYQGDTVPAGMTLDQDVILFGQDVTIDGTVNGNVFILGNEVQVNGTVDGSLILIGQNAAISGSVSGTVYAAALTLDLSPNSVLARDLYAVTVSLTSGKDSLIGRDLYAIGLDSGMNGRVGRDLHTTIGPIQLYNGLMTLLGFENLTLKLHIEIPQPTPEGSNTGNIRPGLATISRSHMRIIQAVPADGFDWGTWGLDLARDFSLLFLLGLLALWLIRPRLEKAGQPLRVKPLQSFGIGLLALVIAFNLFIVALLVAALIFAIGLGLNYLGLWLFAFLFWAISYAILIFIAAILWLFIVYGTKIIAAYAISRWIFDLFTENRAYWVNALSLLAGIAIYALLHAIPYVGWVFSLIFTALGLGSAWLARRERRKEARRGQVSKEWMRNSPAG